MKPVHGSNLEDPDLLHQLVLQELRSRGIDVKLETPKPSKKGIVPFSTPSATHHSNSVVAGRIFGRRLADLSKLLVSLEDIQDTDVLVPKLVVSACKYIEENIEIEGIYRMSGSASRQKAMRKEIDSIETDFREMNPPPSVLDVASLLKQFLRELPLPVVPRIFHSVLASSFASSPAKRVENIMLGVLLLPSDHLASLSFLLNHLNTVAKSSKLNKMTISNLAIVITPNLLPIQEHSIQSNMNVGVKLDKKTVDMNSQKLKVHTSIMELLIQNSDGVGYVNSLIHERYQAFLSLPSCGSNSHSEDNLDEDNVGQNKRKSKKKHVRRRSGSLSRVLSVIGKTVQNAIGRNSSTPGTKVDTNSIHSTPLPQFGGTPEYPSPRVNNAKRKAVGEHELSPTNKQQKRTFESTFTPKMRTRTFSVKRFKRRKSEGKLKSLKDNGLLIAKQSPKPGGVVDPKKTPIISSPVIQKRHTRLSLASTVTTPESKASTSTLTQETVDSMESSVGHGENDDTRPVFNASEDYDMVKAHYEKIKLEVSRLESCESYDSCAEVDERYVAACAAGNLAKETRETARQMARVRRRSSESKKPRSPSERRIGVIRRKSREREEKLNKHINTPEKQHQKSPTCKAALTPLNLHRPSMRTKLQRGHPNTTSVGLDKPSPVLGEENVSGKPRIKMSFKGKDRPVMKVVDIAQGPGPMKATASPLKKKSPAGSQLSHGQSLVSLKNDISSLIEKSFGSGDKPINNSETILEGDNEVFDICDGVTGINVLDCRINLDKEAFHDNNLIHELTDQIQNISFKNKSPLTPLEKSPIPSSEDYFSQSSPVTRAQLRRQSEGFEFTRPDDVEQEFNDTLRRQSSAFEFRSSFVEPIYENLVRDTTRGSLRRRNSSVKDLVLKLESEARRRVGVPDLVNNKPSGNRLRSLDSSVQSIGSEVGSRHHSDPSRIVPEIRVDASKISVEPLRITEVDEEPGLEGWVDASEFFKNVAEADAPQCGRSSIVKIRNQIKGRVQDSVTKFSQPGNTPHRQPGTRRLSARMGTSATTPGLRNAPTSAFASTSITPNTRRQIFTGIKTTAAGNKRPANYATPTISSTNKGKEKSPLYQPVQAKDNARSRDGSSLSVKSRSPNPSITSAPQKKRSPRDHASPNPFSLNSAPQKKKSPRDHTYQNVRVERKNSQKLERKTSNPECVKIERKNSNSRDIKRHLIERSTSGSKGKKSKVRRNRSNAEKERLKRKEERRYLTIGYSGEIRSPLKERQNIPANVRRSNSDQTPNRSTYKSSVILTRSKLKNADLGNIYSNLTNVVRKHSLKSDVLMSPHLAKVDPATPSKYVKRTASERTPRNTPYRKVGTSTPVISLNEHRNRNIELMKSLRVSVDSPRRSPRLANC